MKRIILCLIFSVGILLANAQRVLPNWESINARPYPQWFSDAKLGIFIHWGVYSVPAYASPRGYAEWFYRGWMVNDSTRCGFQNSVYGENFNYKSYAPLFKGELFNASEWADLFKKSGAKYVILVTKHHDGYCMWNSKFQPDWNSVVTGPKRDVVGEVSNAVRATGLKMGLYYSLMEWNNPIHRWTVDTNASPEKYVTEYMIPQFKELVQLYKPSLIFSDGDWDYSAEQLHSAEVIAWYYNEMGDEAIVNDRWGNGNKHGFRTPEYNTKAQLLDRPWAECRGLGRSFGLNRNEPLDNYMTSDELIRHLIRAVAAGGGLTINVGPAADGQIPLLQQERLLDLGAWLQVNGEAIYGTHPFERFYEMKQINDSVQEPFVCYTQKDGVLYAIALEFPDEHLSLNIEGFGKPSRVTLLGCEKPVPFKFKKHRLEIYTDNLKYSDISQSRAAWVFKIEP